MTQEQLAVYSICLQTLKRFVSKPAKHATQAEWRTLISETGLGEEPDKQSGDLNPPSPRALDLGCNSALSFLEGLLCCRQLMCNLPKAEVGAEVLKHTG